MTPSEPQNPPHTYFKATRPDGTDFYSGTILYAVGRTIRPARTSETPHICGPGLLHASSEAGEALLGGSWPCRLFEVSGKPCAGFDERHRYKGGFRQLKVIRELDPYLALGPNGRYVAGIIERTAKLTFDEAQELGAAWNAARGAAWNAAWNAAWGAAWDAARGAAWNAAWGAAWGAARGAAWNAARGAAWNAAWDAAMGAAIKDLITKEQYDLLTGPWRSVCGPIRPTRRKRP